jgi:hypothetical protein
MYFSWNLLLFDGVRKMVVEEGGLKAVVNALVVNEEDFEVQLYGCYALRALFWNDSIWAKAAVDEGGFVLVIAAMNNHPNNANVQKVGCDFFTRLLAADDEYRNNILDAKGLIPVVEVQRIHKDNAELKLAARKAHDAIVA